MEMQLFIQDLTEYIRKIVSADTEVKINTVKKNNGIVLNGLTIRTKDVNIAPNIYLDYYYDRYVQGEDLEVLARNIVETCEEYSIKESFDADFYKNYEVVKPNIFCRLINYEMNKELLEEVPYGRCLDLAIVPYYMLNNKQFGVATILIKNDHLRLWDVSPDEVLEWAISNTSNNMRFEVESLFELLKRKSETFTDDVLPLIDDDGSMQVATNENCNYGAVFMIFRDKLSKLAESIGSDFYIIPSSVHEIIIVTPKEGMTPEYINAMIREINHTQVPCEEILSNHIYRYARADGVLKF